jgi:cytochrome c553
MVLGATLLPLTAVAKGDPEAGKEKSTTCQACHGLDGKAISPTYPNLAGQYASYMEKALRDYRDGRRTNVIMAPMAANLTDQDIKDLAAWYASQEGLKDLSIP